MRRLATGIGRIWLLVALAGLAGCASTAPALVDRDVAIPMRDGVVLRADVYRPPGNGRFPVLVFRTPYGKHNAARSDSTHEQAVARGYAVIMQDVRGRYASEGHFDPYRQEGADGYDTIEWAAGQSWSDGRIGTYGLSYPGAVQWLAAVEAPPHLVAMAPAMTFSSPRRFFYMNGIFDRSWLPWIYENIAPDARRRLGMPDDEVAETGWRAIAGDFQSWLPLRDLPWLRREAPYYFEWLSHPPEDAWWDWAELQGRYGGISAAVLNFSGWYDDAYGVEGAATNFNGLRQARGGLDQARTHLVLGPWDHGVPSATDGLTADLDFGPNAAFDYDGWVLDFHDHYMRGIANRFSRDAPVRYFVMGINEWRDAGRWPPPARRAETLYFDSMTDTGVHRLSASLPSAAASRSTFLADPRIPVVDPHDSPGPHDYRSLASREDLLTFDTEPLPAPLTVAGEIAALVYVSCDCRDFDLWVRLQDVHPDGRAINLMSPGNDALRASYRDRAIGRQPIEPGRIYELRIPAMMTGIRFATGHRIRAQVSASFDPHLSRNLQTGESEVDSAESRPATITIHHSIEHASRLLLPVLD
jgi:putative CocE/NonD family hydrolase